MSTTFKTGQKVAGIYNPGGDKLRWDPTGVVTDAGPHLITVTYSDGTPRVYALPATDYIDHLRICTACGKPGTFNRCIGNGGCGAPTAAA